MKEMYTPERYLLFVGYVYYPNAGMGDFKNSYKSVESARDALVDIVGLEKKDFWEDCWACIWDSKTGENVWSKWCDEEEKEGKESIFE